MFFFISPHFGDNSYRTVTLIVEILIPFSYCFVGNDVCLSENLFVSGNHCFIERDTETGIAWLHDTR